MRNSVALLLVGSLVLGGCSAWRDSRVNPTNWFGQSESVPINVDGEGGVNPLLPPAEEKTGLFDRPEAVDASLPITDVTELRVEPTNTGAIIYATGVAQRQGAYNAALRRNRSEEDAKNGVLTYTFRVVYPVGATPQGDRASRTVHDAVSVSKDTLDGIRLIRVVGEKNALETRRR